MAEVVDSVVVAVDAVQVTDTVAADDEVAVVGEVLFETVVLPEIWTCLPLLKGALRFFLYTLCSVLRSWHVLQTASLLTTGPRVEITTVTSRIATVNLACDWSICNIFR